MRFDLTPTNAKEAEIKQEFSKLMTITNLFYTQLEELIILADERLWDLQFEQNPQVLTRLSEEAKNEISIGKIKDILC
jgi:phosphopentomutase